jgi:CelD/BcsL family acetyltransferase involved in cellulose biosynthesis
MNLWEVRPIAHPSRPEMSETSEAILNDRRLSSFSPVVERQSADREAARLPFGISIFDDFAAAENDWRRFERDADCTVFQSFDWLSAWFRHIGFRSHIRPAIVLVRRADGEPLLLLPLGIVPGIVRRLTWLGNDLCDYNAPLIAKGFSGERAAADFPALWADIRERLQSNPQHHHDLIDLTKMPETLGGQPHPFLQLDVRLNPSGAHLVRLHGTWEQFYTNARSSATRRRDRTKRKRLGEMGEVRFVNPDSAEEIARTIGVLIAQKAKAFARMGVEDIFARPGYREFFLDLATDPRTRQLIHVSRFEVGPVCAATNLGLTFRKRYYHVLASHHDGEVSRYGPGAAHLRDLMARAIEQGFGEFDFTIGDEGYKFEWADTELRLYDHVAAANLRGRPAAAWALGSRRLKRAVKQNAMLWSGVKRTRALLASLLRRKPADADHPAAR